MKLFGMIILFILGACFGSFAVCQAWRVRYKQLGKKDPGKWSVCLHCGYRLRWYDNIPIVSWLALHGKCRKCGKKIGWAEIVMEVAMAVSFVLVGWAYLMPLLDNYMILHWQPLKLWSQVGMVVVLLILLVVMGILAVYDAKWGELPVYLLVTAVILGAGVLALKEWILVQNGGSLTEGLVSAGIGVLILPGTCYLIYKLSNEKLMGGGDWWLALAMALALGNWWLSLWALFLANLLGDVIMMPSVIKNHKNRLYFGPFLVLAFVLVLVLGNCLPTLLLWGASV